MAEQNTSRLQGAAAPDFRDMPDTTDPLSISSVPAIADVLRPIPAGDFELISYLLENSGNRGIKSIELASILKTNHKRTLSDSTIRRHLKELELCGRARQGEFSEDMTTGVKGHTWFYVRVPVPVGITQDQVALARKTIVTLMKLLDEGITTQRSKPRPYFPPSIDQWLLKSDSALEDAQDALEKLGNEKEKHLGRRGKHPDSRNAKGGSKR